MERNDKIKQSIKIAAGILCSAVILISCGSETQHAFLPFSETTDIVMRSGNTLLDSNAKLIGDDLCVPGEHDLASVGLSVDDFNDSLAVLVINDDDNSVLYYQNTEDRFYPASLTKLMTAFIILRDCSFDDTVTITDEMVSLPDPAAKKCGLHAGDTLTVEALLNSTLVTSANDAAKSLAIFHSGSEEAFAAEMNKTAASLCATHSHFMNSHGLHNDEHYTTLYDLYLIFHELIKDDRFISIIGQSSYEMNYHDKNGIHGITTVYSTNKYLNGNVQVPSSMIICGGKTGTTDEAGCCMMFLSEDTIKHRHYIIAVLNASSSSDLYDDFDIVFDKIKSSVDFIQ